MTDNPPPAPPPPPSPATQQQSSKGFLARIFDLSFSEFVTPSLIKIIFILGIVLSGLFSIAILISLANEGDGGVVAGIIVAPIFFFVYVLIARVIAELYLLLFKIEENTRPRR